jgi:hypothetical protein
MLHRNYAVVFRSLFVGLILAPSAWTKAAEPAREFLERLREERMFDMATRYLEIYSVKGWLPASMKADVKLERLMIIQDSLAVAKTVKERDQRLSALESGYKEFFDSSKGHPRRSESGLRLGNLSMDRGNRELKKLEDEAEKSNEKAIRDSARQAFKQAETVFKTVQEELAKILTDMAGAKIATNDTENIALRKQYQGEYRQAQILQGLALKLVATSWPADSKEYKEGLDAADKHLAAVIGKATSATEIGAKTLSRLYRGDVLALMGKSTEALESWTPVADIEQEGIFQLWRVQATTSMVRLMASEKGGNQFEPAIARGESLVKQMAKDEQADPDWLDLQLAIAEAKLALGKELEKKGGNAADTARKAATRDARELLQNIARRPGDHQSKAKKLLSDLGIDIKTPIDTKLPDTKNFTESFAEAKTRMERSESTQLSREILKNRLAEASAQEKPALEDELKAVDEGAIRDRAQALELLQRALKQYRSTDPREDLVTARFYMAYLFIKQDKYWEAAAVSDFVARSGAGTDPGLKAAGFALFAYRKLLDGLPSDRQASLMGSLEALARFMIATWPEAEETQSATLTLLQNALRNQQWDDAERFLEYMPKAAGQSNATRRDLGYVLWIQYLIGQDAERKAGNTHATGDLKLRDRAERLLTEGWNSLDMASLDQRAVEAANALASLYLRTDRLDKAVAVLNKEKIGPLAVVNSKSSPVTQSSVKLEALRLSLQAKVTAAGTGKGSLEAKEVEAIVKSMQSSAEGDDKLLTNTLLALAKDLREQLEQVKDPADQAKLAAGIEVLLTQLAEVSDIAGILDWAGTTLWQLASGLEKAPGAKATVKKLNGAAAHVFAKMLEADKKDKDFLQAINRKPEDVQLKQALAYRGQADYAKASELFLEILKVNNTQLTAQIEAAKNFQTWAAGKDVDLLKKALYGAERNDKGKNIIWGWGQMSKMLSSQMGNRKELQAIFFDARLQIAVCRRSIALADPTERQKNLEAALNDIKQTSSIYPELGDAASKKAFDDLVKTIQKDLGKPTVGLEEFAPGPANN